MHSGHRPFLSLCSIERDWHLNVHLASKMAALLSFQFSIELTGYNVEKFPLNIVVMAAMTFENNGYFWFKVVQVEKKTNDPNLVIS